MSRHVLHNESVYPAKCIQLGYGEMISQRPSMSHPPIVVNLVQPGMHGV